MAVLCLSEMYLKGRYNLLVEEMEFGDQEEQEEELGMGMESLRISSRVKMPSSGGAGEALPMILPLGVFQYQWRFGG